MVRYVLSGSDVLPEQYNERGNSECEEKKWKQEARIQSVVVAAERRPVVLGEKRRKEEQAVLGLMLVVTLWTDARPCVQCNI